MKKEFTQIGMKCIILTLIFLSVFIAMYLVIPKYEFFSIEDIPYVACNKITSTCHVTDLGQDILDNKNK